MSSGLPYPQRKPVISAGMPKSRTRTVTPQDGIRNPVGNVLCNGRTVVRGHNVRVGITNPDPRQDVLSLRSASTASRHVVGLPYPARKPVISAGMPKSRPRTVTPPDGIRNPVGNVLCNGRTVVRGHNVRVAITNPGPRQDVLSLRSASTASRHVAGVAGPIANDAPRSSAHPTTLGDESPHSKGPKKSRRLRR